MKVLAIMRPADDGDVRRKLATRALAELGAVWGLYRDGVVRELYSPGGPGIVMILEVPCAQAAADRLRVLPLLADGVMALETIELHPFGALEMLFAHSATEGAPED